MSDWAETALGNPEALPNHIAFDVNLDGQISEEEFRSRLTDEFDRLDRDHDGELTRAEMLMDVPLRSQGGAGGGTGGGGTPARRWRWTATSLIPASFRRPSGRANHWFICQMDFSSGDNGPARDKGALRPAQTRSFAAMSSSCTPRMEASAPSTMAS